jgi:hypothetical protein
MDRAAVDEKIAQALAAALVAELREEMAKQVMAVKTVTTTPKEATAA